MRLKLVAELGEVGQTMCASLRLRVRKLSKYPVRRAHVPRLVRLVTSRANKSHLITT